MNLGEDLLFGVLLGFSLTIPPGPMNALIASHAARSRRLGIIAGTGAMSADAVLGIIAFSLRSEIDLAPFTTAIYLLGAAVLVIYGLLVLRSRSGPTTELQPGFKVYSTAFALGLGNPFQILWWLTAGLAFAFVGGALLFVGLFGAIAIWVVVFPTVIDLGVRDRPKVQQSIIVLSSLLMFGFAAYLLFLALA